MTQKLIGVSQRVEVCANGERRDALDQRWHTFLRACGFAVLPLPNCQPDDVTSLLEEISPSGILLTGGNDLAVMGGTAPERDAAEAAMLTWAVANRTPVLGVCRGLQMILSAGGAALHRVHNHAGSRHKVEWQGQSRDVNSYHHWGVSVAPETFDVTARSSDGSIEAVHHRKEAVAGIMWHPEREAPFVPADIAFFRQMFGMNQ